MSVDGSQAGFRLLERERELAALEELLRFKTGFVAVEAGIGLGKTALLHAACERAQALGYQVLRASGVELEQDFALGVVRQLFERHLASVDAGELETLLDGAAAARPLLRGREVGAIASDTSFSVQHGLYWLAANLSAVRPLLLAVDDAHWADEPSLRWMVYLARRLEGLRLVMLAAFRPQEPTTANRSLLALRGEAAALLNPALLSQDAIAELVRATIVGGSNDNIGKSLWVASGGNPLYLCELLRGLEQHASPVTEPQPAQLRGSSLEKIGRGVIARVRSLDPAALRLAQALAVLGERCTLGHAAAIAGLNITDAIRLTAGLVRLEVLSSDDPPGFIHPVIRQALEASLGSDERDAAHRAAARLLHADQSPAGRVAAHLLRVRPAEDEWVLARLREAGEEAMESGAPGTAADLLNRALSEPPHAARRIGLLRETAHAEASAGREAAFVHLDEARRIVGNSRERFEIALEAAAAYATLFRWTDAVNVITQALAELNGVDEALRARLQSELVVCGFHDARCAAQVAPVLQQLSSVSHENNLGEAVAVAQGMAMALAGRPGEEIAVPLESALSRARAPTTNWDTRAALLWSLVTAERFHTVETALGPMLAEVHRSGSARGMIATYSTLGLLKLRLGALPEADSAARVALRVLQEGDFRPGLPFAATVLADVAIEAGELGEAEAMLALLPQAGWPAGVGTVLIPAARGRLRLAQGRVAEALDDFKLCMVMFNPETWGGEIVGYVHARAGAALALLHLGDRALARDMAQAELAQAKRFGAPRALAMALRTTGLVEGGEAGLALLTGSVAALRASPARLEQAHSLAELGAALRRAGHRAAAREPLTEALDLAARCGARASAARLREELKAIGARPRSEWRTGLEALSPRELHVARLATEGLSNREIAHRLYVTLKTVEGHLARAFTKLGIERRGELRPLLEREKTRAPTL
jgi:DNA-binding CsgD family transcriptional regulator